MKCLVDNQLPPALARFLTARGIDTEHVIDVDMADATDREIWQYGADHDRVLISKDEDFLNIASKNSGTKLIWVRLGNCRTPTLLQAFEKLWPQIEECFDRGDQVVEIR